MFDNLEVIPELQLQRQEGVCETNTFLSQIHSESHNSN